MRNGCHVKKVGQREVTRTVLFFYDEAGTLMLLCGRAAALLVCEM